MSDIDGVFTVDDVKDIIYKNYHVGASKGSTTFIPQLDSVMKWKSEFIYVLTAYPNLGKTTFISYITLAKSIGDGSKWAFFSPEGQDAADFYEELVHTLTGCSTDKDYRQVPKDRLDWALDFIGKHFFFVMPNAHTHENITDIFIKLHNVHGLFGVIIDGYNSLEVNSGSQEYLAIRNFLIKQRDFTTRHKITSYIVAHPKKPAFDNGGEFTAPNQFDISGGAVWNDKLDHISAFHRPNYFIDKHDTTCTFESLKVKAQKRMHLCGKVEMTFDRAKNRYLFNGQDPLQELINQKLRTEIQPSDDFNF